jgi:threonine dehydratase
VAAGRVDAAGIEATERRIRAHIRRTPVVEACGADFGLPDFTLVFKLELCQHTGSFKPRGAFANLVGRELPASGVVAASGGNHGVAVAYAASKLAVPARIFVPAVASPSKLEKIRACGAELTIVGERYADALAASELWARESGALPVHAYDQPGTLLGQGTLGLELEQQAAGLDTLLVAVGGGGLIGGVASWFADRIEHESLRLVGVEPETAPTLTAALRAGHPVDAPAGGIAADSLAPRRVGELMFPIARRLVSDVLLVSDASIRAAQQALWSTLRIAPEPGGAAAFAALTSGRYVPASGERVGVVVCGGNTSAVDFSNAGWDQ